MRTCARRESAQLRSGSDLEIQFKFLLFQPTIGTAYQFRFAVTMLFYLDIFNA